MNLIQDVKYAIQQGQQELSKLPIPILRLSGMSSPKVRHFLNNLIQQYSRYLEIGCWRGSTFVSALYNNNPQVAFAIDDWSEFNTPNFQIFAFDSVFGLPENIFRYNVTKYLKCNYTIISQNCFTIQLSRYGIKNINTFFYDGAHDYESQYKALFYYYQALTDEFIFIVDDYNDENAQHGTQDSIKDLQLTPIFEYIAPARFNGDIENWWDGLYISVLRKK